MFLILGEYEPLKDFCCITFIRLQYQDATRVVSCCSECQSRMRLIFYCTSDFNDQRAPFFESNSICSCPHVNAVLMSCVDPRLPKDESFPYQAQLCLSAGMKVASPVPSGWISIGTRHSRGQLMLFVSERLETHVFAVTHDESNDAVSIYCFACTKSNCRHRALVTSDDGEIDELLPLLGKNQPKNSGSKIPKITPVLSSIISTQRYPCM